jgi:hypothetical protein
MELQPLFAAIATMDLAMALVFGAVWLRDRNRPRHQQRFGTSPPNLLPLLIVVFLAQAVLFSLTAAKG